MGCQVFRLIAVYVLFCSLTAYGANPFHILSREGIHISDAELQELRSDRFRYRVDGNENEVDRSAIVCFHTLLEPKPRSSGSAMLRLVNGDLLAGKPATLEDSGIDWVFNPNDRFPVRVRIPLVYVLGISFDSSLKDSLKSLVPRESQTGSDKLRLANGDELTGDLSEMSLKALSLETETGTKIIPLKTVRTILFNEELTETPSTEPHERTLIMLEQGTRITLSDFRISRSSVFSGKTVFGESLELSLNKLRAAVLLDASVQPLIEREPNSVTYQPFLSAIPAVRKNFSVRGGPLQIGNQPYLTGLGMQSRTEMTWILAPTDEFLISDIGLDAEAKQRGSLRFRVLLDGQQVFESSELTGRDPPQSIRVDLREKRSVTLIADFGKDADVLDLAVWGNTLILRKPPAD